MNPNTNPLPVRGHSSDFGRRIAKISAIALTALAAGSPFVQATGLVVDTGTLTIAPTGIFNIQDNNLVVRTGVLGDANGLNGSGITGYVKTGLFNGPGGYWDGPGINSSVAAVGNITAVGVVSNADIGYTNWPIDGTTGLPQAWAVALLGAEILVKFTYFGDADLSGFIDLTDYGQIDTAFGGGGGTGWINGDFDYSGGVPDLGDYGLIDSSFGAQSGTLVSQGAAQAVPEPTSASLLLIGAIGFLARRSSRRRSVNC